MKHLILFTLLLLHIVPAIAQGLSKTVEKDDGTYDYHYFQSSETPSTLQFTPSADGEGYAVAYNKAGAEIYRKPIAQEGKSQVVTFNYHPSGAVSVAKHAWAAMGSTPAGGISTYFDENGNKLRESRDAISRDDLKNTGGANAAANAGMAKENPMYRTEYRIVNRLENPILITYAGKGTENAEATTREVLPGDTLQVGSHSEMNVHPSPCDHGTYTLSARKAKWVKGLSIDCKKATYVEPQKGIRTYFIVVR